MNKIVYVIMMILCVGVVSATSYLNNFENPGDNETLTQNSASGWSAVREAGVGYQGSYGLLGTTCWTEPIYSIATSNYPVNDTRIGGLVLVNASNDQNIGGIYVVAKYDNNVPPLFPTPTAFIGANIDVSGNVVNMLFATQSGFYGFPTMTCDNTLTDDTWYNVTFTLYNQLNGSTLINATVTDVGNTIHCEYFGSDESTWLTSSPYGLSVGVANGGGCEFGTPTRIYDDLFIEDFSSAIPCSPISTYNGSYFQDFTDECGIEDFTYTSGHDITTALNNGGGVSGTNGIDVSTCWFYDAWLKVNSNFPVNDTNFGGDMFRNSSNTELYVGIGIDDGTQTDTPHNSIKIQDIGDSLPQLYFIDSTNTWQWYYEFTCNQAPAPETWLHVNGTLIHLNNDNQLFNISYTDDFGMVCSLEKEVNESWMNTEGVTVALGNGASCDYGNQKRTYDNIFMNDISQVCEPVWRCSSYEACDIDHYRHCNAVVDDNSCNVNYTGNFSEFTPIFCPLLLENNTAVTDNTVKEDREDLGISYLWSTYTSTGNFNISNIDVNIYEDVNIQCCKEAVSLNILDENQTILYSSINSIQCLDYGCGPTDISNNTDNIFRFNFNMTPLNANQKYYLSLYGRNRGLNVGVTTKTGQNIGWTNYLTYPTGDFSLENHTNTQLFYTLYGLGEQVSPPSPVTNDITGEVTNQVVQGTVSVFVIVIVIAVLISLAIGFAGYIGLVNNAFMVRSILITLVGAVLLLLIIAFRMFVLV